MAYIGTGEDVAICCGLVRPEELVRSSMEMIPARFRIQKNDATVGAPELRRITCSNHLELSHCFHTGTKTRIVIPIPSNLHTIQLDGVPKLTLAVHGEIN